ncbi:MAG: PqqD family peptide modification chaperone [bacterium]|nr:MAG: PqqD family peptide modification chaperone [bacterium]
MDDSLFSPSWYRVSGLQPRLRNHAHIHRHSYGGEVWYILQDHVSGRFYRFTPIAYYVIGLMNGKRTIQEIWEMAAERFGDDAPTQGDMIRVLSQLHSADVLVSTVPPDVEEIFSRGEKISRSKIMAYVKSPLFMRFPLFDPEKLLARTAFIFRPAFSWIGFVVWSAAVGWALFQAVQHWPELTNNIVDRILSGQNLLIIGLVYPVIKALHEFGHAYAVKRWGGEVHEMGIMLLVLMPLPYVDASSASAFTLKRRRILVTASGIMVELFIASIAMFAWLNLNHGIARSVAFNAMFIGSVSTVLFNANPLLRYDGYYLLSDLLEIPNLAQRSVTWIGYLVKRYLFGMKKTERPYARRDEKFWLTTYSIAAFIYRAFIYVSIILFISGKFFIIGILLGIWAFFNMVVAPVFSRIKFVVVSPVLRDKRVQAVAISMAAIGLVAALTFWMPFPSWTRTEGVIWVPEGSLVRAGTSGFVSEIQVPSGEAVRKGQILIQCVDPLLDAQLRVQEASLRALQARYEAEFYYDRVQAAVTKEELLAVQAMLVRTRERSMELTISSPVEGTLILPGEKDLPGLFVNQGDLLAYVIQDTAPTIRTVVSQAEVDLVRRQNEGVLVRLTEDLDRIYEAKVLREVPGAEARLPSNALGLAGGGELAVAPWDQEGVQAMENLFHFELQLPLDARQAKVGARVYVRFDHGSTPLAHQWYRSLRQMFLKRFNV